MTHNFRSTRVHVKNFWGCSTEIFDASISYMKRRRINSIFWVVFSVRNTQSSQWCIKMHTTICCSRSLFAKHQDRVGKMLRRFYQNAISAERKIIFQQLFYTSGRIFEVSVNGTKLYRPSCYRITNYTFSLK